MRCLKEPRIGGQLKGKEKLVRGILKDRFPDVFFAVVLNEGKNRLEIHPPLLLKQPYFRDSDLVLVGLAKSRDEAERLTAELLSKAYREGVLGDLRKLFAEEAS